MQKALELLGSAVLVPLCILAAVVSLSYGLVCLTFGKRLNLSMYADS